MLLQVVGYQLWALPGLNRTEGTVKILRIFTPRRQTAAVVFVCDP